MKNILFLLIFGVLSISNFPSLYGQTITTIAGKGTVGYSGDGGPATDAEFNTIKGLATDRVGNVYVADAVNNYIRKIDKAGIITTVAGNGSSVYSGDGGQATAAGLGNPGGIAVDRFGNLYIGEMNNHRVRKVTPAGIISTIAGNGYGAPFPGSFGGDGAAATNAMLNGPNGIVVDSQGNIYIVDVYNYRIRKVNQAGIISTVAGVGSGGYSGDGRPATMTHIFPIGELAVDKYGNIIFSDFNNFRIRKVDTTGSMTTIAGIGVDGFSGDNGPATLAKISHPIGIDIAPNGDIYFSGGGLYQIRKINTAGIITTVAGNGTIGFSGDGGPAIAASLMSVYGLAIDTAGAVYVADKGNNRVRMISSTVFVSPVNILQQGINIYPNPATDYLTVENRDKTGFSYIIINLFGQTVLSGSLGVGNQDIAIRDLANGTYCLNILRHDGYSATKFFVKK